MSRRRTTSKMYRANEKEESRAPAAPPTEAAAAAERSGDSVAEQHESAIGDGLGPWLAAEAERREASEQRTADTVGRYYKVTLAILCLNMVVGGANVAVLIMQSGEPRTVVVTQPAPAQPPVTAPPQPAPAPSPVTAATPPSAEDSTPSAVTSPDGTPAAGPQLPLLGKAPLLGKPAKPAPRPSRASEVESPARAVTAPAKPHPRFADTPTTTDEEPAAPPTHFAVERW